MEKMKNCSISVEESEISESPVSTVSDCEMVENANVLVQHKEIIESSSPALEEVVPQCEIQEDCTITKVTRSLKKGFSQQEDLCIKKGVQKYGWGEWAQILHDTDYQFHENRGANTIQRRANLLKQKGFICNV